MRPPRTEPDLSHSQTVSRKPLAHRPRCSVQAMCEYEHVRGKISGPPAEPGRDSPMVSSYTTGNRCMFDRPHAHHVGFRKNVQHLPLAEKVQAAKAPCVRSASMVPSAHPDGRDSSDESNRATSS